MDFERYMAGLRRRREGPGHAGLASGPENLVVVPRLDSTNTLARAIVAEYQNEAQTLHPLIVVALEQTGGRGRQGRSWSSPAGKGVYATRVVQVDDAGMLQTLPLLAGVGLCRALGAHLPVPCRLKWPNDLLVEVGDERRKIGGILIEAAVRPGEATLALIGFGVNVFHDAVELPETATSARLLGGSAGSLEDFTWDLVEGLEAELVHLGDAAYAVESYRALSIHRPGERIVCRVGESVSEGTFVGFDESGRLLLESEGRVVPIASGEVIEE
ncbi:MAG TPA: biotin--[acetyl-CoA-carboxylase] ligase [Thermoanaerobaculia bacterium]|nr:biotin--[acetyl-CoA-carboxylase] ligase [Thermoanaerobaculia bacterium]